MLPCIEKIIDYTIPFCGNKKLFPYATLLVCSGETRKVIKTKEDRNGSYFVFNRKRYRIANRDSLYSPKLEVTAY